MSTPLIPIPKRLLSAHVASLAVFCSIPSASGQGTFHFGFEGDPLGSLPQNIRPFFPGQLASVESTLPGIEPIEGDHMFAVFGGISLRSPNAEPISSFRLYYHARDGGFEINVGSGNNFTTAPGNIFQWQTLSGSVSTPTSELQIYGTEPNIEFPQFRTDALFTLDSIDITTVPEPSTLCLFGGGLLSLLLRLRKR
jgi:hypothetical protein